SDLWGRCLLYRSNDPCAGGVPAQSAFLSYHKSRPVTRRGRALSGDAKTEMGTASLRSPSAGIWQAWRSPASLGFPLSVPAACGCHEIDHLKHRPYSWQPQDRKSTRLNSSHVSISYAVFCLKKKNTHTRQHFKGQPKRRRAQRQADGL